MQSKDSSHHSHVGGPDSDEERGQLVPGQQNNPKKDNPESKEEVERRRTAIVRKKHCAGIAFAFWQLIDIAVLYTHKPTSRWLQLLGESRWGFNLGIMFFFAGSAVPICCKFEENHQALGFRNLARWIPCKDCLLSTSFCFLCFFAPGLIHAISGAVLAQDITGMLRPMLLFSKGIIAYFCTCLLTTLYENWNSGILERVVVAERMMKQAKLLALFGILMPSFIFISPFLWEVLILGKLCKDQQDRDHINLFKCRIDEELEAVGYMHYEAYQATVVEQIITLNWMLGNVISYAIFRAGFFSLKCSRRITWAASSADDTEVRCWGTRQKINGRILYFLFHLMMLLAWTGQLYFLFIAAVAPNDFDYTDLWLLLDYFDADYLLHCFWWCESIR
jgi:hypothetical protein